MLNHIDVEIDGQTYSVDRMHGIEGLARPFLFHVIWRMPKLFDAATWIGKTASLLFYDSSGLTPIRTFRGVITKAKAQSQWKDQDQLVQLSFRPRIALLKNWNGPRVFVEQTVQTILERLLKEHASYGAQQIHWHLQRSLPFKPFILQVPNEKDSDFFHRLMARYGVFYWLDSDDHIHFTDHHDDLPKRVPSLISSADRGLGSSTLTQSRVIQNRVPETFIVRDYSEEYPDQILEAKASSTSTPEPWLTQNLYGLGAKTPDEAQQLADLYLERAQVESQYVIADSHVMDLSAGLRVSLKLASSQEKFSGDYIATTIEHCFSYNDNEPKSKSTFDILKENRFSGLTNTLIDPNSLNLGEAVRHERPECISHTRGREGRRQQSINSKCDGYRKLAVLPTWNEILSSQPGPQRRPFSQKSMLKGTGYRMRFKAIPFNHPYRLALCPFPAMPFNLSAFVEANEAGQIMDDQGKYRVKFHFDRESAPGKGSIPLRRIQRDAGPMSPMDSDDQKVGMHFPLSAGTEVLVGFWHGDPDRPVILAAVPSPAHPGPVSECNSTQAILRTPKGQEMVFEGHREKSHIALRNSENTQELLMSCSPENDTLSLRTRTGDFYTYSKTDSQFSTEANAHTVIFGDQTIKAEKTLQQTSQASMHQQTEKDVYLKAEQDIQIQSAQSMEMTSDGNTEMNVEQDMQIKGNSALLSAQKGCLKIEGESVQWISQGPIHIGNKSAGILLDPSGEVTVYGASVGGMAMASPNVTNDPSPGGLLGAPSITTPQPNTKIEDFEPRFDLNVSGFHWSQTESEVSQSVEACFTIQNGKPGDSGKVRIYRLRSSDSSQQNVAILSFQLSEDEKAGYLEKRVIWTPSESIEVTAIGTDAKTISDHVETLSPKTKPQSDLFTFEVMIGVHEFQDKDLKPLTLQKTVTIKPVYANGEAVLPGIHIRLQDLSGEWQDYELTSDVHPLENLTIGIYPIQMMIPDSMKIGLSSKTSHEPLELLDYQYQHPYPVGLLFIQSLKESTQAVLLPSLPPFSGMDIREDSPTWNATKPCSDLIIDSLQKNGQSVTLFLHGYNVPRGEWGYYYDEIQEKKIATPTALDPFAQTTTYQGQSTEIPCTIYRDYRACTDQFPTFASLFPRTNDSIEKILHPFQEGQSTDSLTSDQPPCLFHPNLQWDEEGNAATLNGTEGRRWGIEMEYNLNRAAGWDSQDYRNYSRVMPVLWSGDFGALNFANAVTHTARAGKRLAMLIRYLHAHGISEINVIAHSLGNEVLLVAMHELGDQNQLFLNHVFLWEPAVPQNALAPAACGHACGEFPDLVRDKTEPTVLLDDVRRALWYDFPKAYQAAKKITVLSSQNDNILGRLLSEDECDALKLNRHDILHSKPWAESLAAIFMTELQVESVFALATWARANPLDLFKPEKQDQIYEMFRYAHVFDTCRTTCRSLEKKLDEQIAALEQSGNLDAVVQGKCPVAFSPGDPPVHYTYPDIAQKLVNWEKTTGEIISFVDHLNHDFADLLNIPYFLFAGAEIALMSFAAVNLWEFLAREGIVKTVEDAVTIVAKGKKIKKYVQHAIDHTHFLICLKRFYYLFHILFNEIPYRPVSAMGYLGIDKATEQMLGNQYSFVEQTLWLWSHSGMMIPSKELMEEVYKKRIWKNNTDYHFGKYRA